MQRATTLAEAFVLAAAAQGGAVSRNWIARSVADKAIYTKTGVVKEKDVHVSCSKKTRERIMQNNGVDVWS